MDPDAEADVVVADLERVLQHITEVQATIETYKEYQRLFELEPEDFGPMVQCEKEANARHQLWKGMLDFMEKSSAWTEDPILNDDGEVQLSIETIRSEVDDYAARAYKMGKANKEASAPSMPTCMPSVSYFDDHPKF